MIKFSPDIAWRTSSRADGDPPTADLAPIRKAPFWSNAKSDQPVIFRSLLASSSRSIGDNSSRQMIRLKVRLELIREDGQTTRAIERKPILPSMETTLVWVVSRTYSP